jgi:hypothetical protein
MTATTVVIAELAAIWAALVSILWWLIKIAEKQ